MEKINLRIARAAWLKLSYRALQRMFGKSVNTRAPGKFNRELARKAESAGGKILEFPTKLGCFSNLINPGCKTAVGLRKVDFRKELPGRCQIRV